MRNPAQALALRREPTSARGKVPPPLSARVNDEAKTNIFKLPRRPVHLVKSDDDATVEDRTTVLDRTNPKVVSQEDRLAKLTTTTAHHGSLIDRIMEQGRKRLKEYDADLEALRRDIATQKGTINSTLVIQRDHTKKSMKALKYHHGRLTTLEEQMKDVREQLEHSRLERFILSPPHPRPQVSAPAEDMHRWLIPSMCGVVGTAIFISLIIAIFC